MAESESASKSSLHSTLRTCWGGDVEFILGYLTLAIGTPGKPALSAWGWAADAAPRKVSATVPTRWPQGIRGGTHAQNQEEDGDVPSGSGLGYHCFVPPSPGTYRGTPGGPKGPPDGPHNSPTDGPHNSPTDRRADSPQTAPRQPTKPPFTKTPS